MSTPTERLSGLKADARLRVYFSDEAERNRITRQMFDEVAADYDLAESFTGLGSGSWYRRKVLRENGLARAMSILDVAAGTGLVTVEAAKLVGPQGHVYALDPSPGMLKELAKKLDVQTIEAYAEAIPLADAQVDFVSMGYALRHVGDIDRAFAEYFRVLRPGGRVCIKEITRPRNRSGQALLRFYLRVMVPLLARITRGRVNVQRMWEYFGTTIDAAIEPDHVVAALRQAGFRDARSQLTLGIFREYLGSKP